MSKDKPPDNRDLGLADDLTVDLKRSIAGTAAVWIRENLETAKKIVKLEELRKERKEKEEKVGV